MISWILFAISLLLGLEIAHSAQGPLWLGLSLVWLSGFLAAQEITERKFLRGG